MCSGAFNFYKGNNYEVVFSIMDASGNQNLMTAPIKFTKPTFENSEHKEDR